MPVQQMRLSQHGVLRQDCRFPAQVAASEPPALGASAAALAASATRASTPPSTATTTLEDVELEQPKSIRASANNEPSVLDMPPIMARGR